MAVSTTIQYNAPDAVSSMLSTHLRLEGVDENTHEALIAALVKRFAGRQCDSREIAMGCYAAIEGVCWPWQKQKKNTLQLQVRQIINAMISCCNERQQRAIWAEILTPR